MPIAVTLGNSLAGRPSRSSSLSSFTVTIATTIIATTTREVNGPGPLDVEGKNGEGESRVSFPWCVMGCFGSQSSKASQDDSKNQKRRSDAITRQLQKDKQVYRATHRLLLLGKLLLRLPTYLHLRNGPFILWSRQSEEYFRLLRREKQVKFVVSRVHYVTDVWLT